MDGWLERWALRRAVERRVAKGGGILVWVDAKGVEHDLGAYTGAELEGLGWAVEVGYRSSRVRWERTRLAGLRQAGARLRASGARLKGEA